MSRSDQAAWVASTSAFGGHWAEGKYERTSTPSGRESPVA